MKPGARATKTLSSGGMVAQVLDEVLGLMIEIIYPMDVPSAMLDFKRS